MASSQLNLVLERLRTSSFLRDRFDNLVELKRFMPKLKKEILSNGSDTLIRLLRQHSRGSENFLLASTLLALLLDLLVMDSKNVTASSNKLSDEATALQTVKRMALLIVEDSQCLSVVVDLAETVLPSPFERENEEDNREDCA